MTGWFICKVIFEKTLENGRQKKVKEDYLVDALSFTEAEARIIENLKPFISGEFTVEDIKKFKTQEVFFHEDGDAFYKVKFNIITLDEKSGNEKKTAAFALIQASSIKDAEAKFTEDMKGTLMDIRQIMIEETKIMDVFPYEAPEEGDKEDEG